MLALCFCTLQLYTRTANWCARGKLVTNIYTKPDKFLYYVSLSKDTHLQLHMYMYMCMGSYRVHCWGVTMLCTLYMYTYIRICQ